MSEDSYLRHKRGQDPVPSPTRETESPKRLETTSRRRRYQPLPDYTAFKATISNAVEDIKVEIQTQHQQTRAEVQTVGQAVAEAARISPTQYVKATCEFAAIFLVFALLVRFTLKIELVNTAFALFMLPALAIYWAMAHLKQKTGGKGQPQG